MRARLQFLSALCLCGALLAACASTPSHEQIQATFDEGLRDFDAHNYKAAYDKWKSIEHVDVAAMRNLALMLRKGEGIEKDPKAAQQMMLEAAEAGLVTAQADLGEMLVKGEAGPPDPKAAVPWLAAAAQAGHPLAAFQLGQLYEQGTGVQKDLDTARKLYALAAKAGVQAAADKIKGLPPEPAPTDHVQAAPLSAPPPLRH